MNVQERTYISTPSIPAKLAAKEAMVRNAAINIAVALLVVYACATTAQAQKVPREKLDGFGYNLFTSLAAFALLTAQPCLTPRL